MSIITKFIVFLEKQKTYKISYDNNYIILSAEHPEKRIGRFAVAGSKKLELDEMITYLHLGKNVYEITMNKYDGNRYFYIRDYCHRDSGFEDGREYNIWLRLFFDNC